MQARRKQGFVGALAVLLTGGLAIAQADPSNKWRIQVDGEASTAGSLQITLVPVGGVAQVVEVPVPEGFHENHVARLIRDALKQAIGKDYHVEIDDGEDVLVKRRLGRPDLDLQLTGNSVQGIKLKQHKE